MKKLGLNEIRKKFLDFYASKGHYIEKSASLIPRNDKSLLIINSGMAPLKPYFAGVETPPAKRMATCQKCVRTGDIENVGVTARHGTFFEMLGSFSFGDYFKKESLQWGWEFMTEVLGLEPEKLWATIYLDDDEAEEIWKNIGIDPTHIVRLGKEDNFWEIGLGPCGPCSEIHYDRGEKYGCGKPDCKPGCDCDRYLEIWNHVFTQFSKEEDGSYSNLAHPNIDTGMGLERLACVMQGVDSMFDVDTVKHIIDGISAKSGVKYEAGDKVADTSIRIIADHMRSMVFMIADGILPSNEGRGYVLRRLIRRAARHCKLLGIDSSTYPLVDLSNKVMDVSGEAYPELLEKKDYIQKVIKVEEEKFAQTLDQGMQILKEFIDQMKKLKKTVLDGAKVFKLYDTYGFPVELTEEILNENKCKIDFKGFEKHMKDQKEMARAGRKDVEGEAWKDKDIEIDIEATKFVGYNKLQEKSKILAIVNKNGLCDTANQSENVEIYLDKTPFYATSGGQINDKGFMSTDDCNVEITNVEKQDNYFVHIGTILKGKLSVGDFVEAQVDKVYRHRTERNHTATHLLQKALQEVLGTHVQQAGSSVTPESLRFDFTHFEAMKTEEIAKVEKLVNDKIEEFMPVETKEMSMDEASKLGAMALFGEKYGKTVRVVNSGGWSIELCGGTHVSNTGEIGAFKIASESGVASGVRRIEACTGAAVLAMLNDYEESVNRVSNILKTNPSDLRKRAEAVVQEVKDFRNEIEKIKKSGMGDEISALVRDAEDIKGIKFVTKQFQDAKIDDLRDFSDKIREQVDKAVVLFSTVNGDKATLMMAVTDNLTDEYNAGQMIKEVAKVANGGGGGKANMAQAGIKSPEKIKEAFAVAKDMI